MPLPVWLPTWLTNLLGAGWLRGLLGIRKDLVDTKKAKLEVKKLQAEERTRESLITPATLDDVKKYDPKYQAISKKAQEEFLDDSIDGGDVSVPVMLLAAIIVLLMEVPGWLWGIIIALFILLVIFLLNNYLRFL